MKLLFINAYRYEHQANELWRGGCLTGLRSVTDDNGRRYEVDAQPRETGLVLTRHAPERAQVTLDADCPASFAYWDRERLGRDRLINSQNGEAARALGLRFAGVDLIATGPDDPAPVVLEVNAGPGLSYFHRLGAREAETVERIYEGLVDALLS